MDEVDLASQAEQTRMAQLLEGRTRLSLPLTGLCHNCSEPVDTHFCDADCRDDYEKRQQPHLRR
ncbi:hypothetical protein [Yokenella regensburgei]|jgi:hypothetical protein|uniref:hypothetical protein n=1 Tax=Yokenella regensburgei TaxID=158877 RepID=UPI001ED98370|nr:hypothetical protein [Yokenella regensburgei]KAF1366396.1 hypothetical protein FHR25_005134 [Yokenella regensburgei]